MAKFQDPPLRTQFHKLPAAQVQRKETVGQQLQQQSQQIMDEGWQRYFISSTNRHSQPNIPVITAPPTTGKAGDLRTDGNFLYVCIKDNPVVIWKKVALT